MDFFCIYLSLSKKSKTGSGTDSVVSILFKLILSVVFEVVVVVDD
jgi:hypothetical protein